MHSLHPLLNAFVAVNNVELYIKSCARTVLFYKSIFVVLFWHYEVSSHLSELKEIYFVHRGCMYTSHVFMVIHNA